MPTGMLDPVNDGQSQFPDPANEFALQRAQLARRRELAKSLIASGAEGNTGSGYQGGKVYIVGNPLGNIAQSIAGNYMDSKADQQQSALDAQENAATRELINRLGTPGTVEQTYDPEANPGTGPLINGTVPMTPQEEASRRLSVMGEGLAIPSLRKTLEAQIGQELDYPNKERMLDTKLTQAQAIADAKNDAMMKGIDARIAGAIALKGTQGAPTIHITNSGNGGGDGFGGAAPVIGSNPRDESPVYRHTKSGKLFQYDANGQPVAYEGAVAPKPVAAKEPTGEEKTAAGYLGRMEASEKNLGNAKAFSMPVQVGLDRAPNATNFVMTPEQQVQRQQQEDWVRAKLRKESGAVIGDDEMAREIRTYFPMAGDSDKVIRQKAQSRAQALEQMRSSAGRAKSTEAAPVQKTIVREVKLKDGRIGVEYSDGSRGYK